MKAIVRLKAGKNLSTMKVKEISRTSLHPDQVRVKMISSRINPVDTDLMKGFPSLHYKDPQIGGVDGAGVITDLGENVNGFKIGDNVFFYRKFTDIGTWAEEITIDTAYISRIPNNISPVNAGAITLPLLTAYEAIEALNVETGKKILIHGAGGGVGFIAVQFAKTLGLEVYANASIKDYDVLMELGAVKFLDYRSQDFSKELAHEGIDYVFDTIGKDTLEKSIALGPEKIVSVALPNTSNMYKTGVELSFFMKLIMNLIGRKFRRMAVRSGVQLIGQVTGADGKALKAASKFAEETDLSIKNYRTITLDAIEKHGFGGMPVGRVILFNKTEKA